MSENSKNDPENGDGDSERKKDLRVGYGRPPIEKRFTKGQSGNSKGSSKRVRERATNIHEKFVAQLGVLSNKKYPRTAMEELNMFLASTCWRWAPSPVRRRMTG